jgi:GAF domain-containing protein
LGGLDLGAGEAEKEGAFMEQVEGRLSSTAVINQLQDLVLKTEDVRELLDELVQFTAAALADHTIAFCSITLMQRQKPVTVARSAERAIRLDESQYQVGEGPCLAAIRGQVVVHVPDVGHDSRWPEYMETARKEGIGSSLSIPLVLEGEAGAGLNLYSTRPHGFSDEDIAAVEAYALRASKALRMAVRISELTEAKSRLVAAMDARTTIDLAAGAIMAQNRCNHDAALKIMNIAARARQLTLRDTAESVIASISEDPRVRTHFDG